MLRSMYAGISGMKNFQTKLDVIGNNIANVNTSGFKKGRVTFQEMMAQTTSGAQGPTNTRGGINPAQVGLGSQLGSIDNIQTQGFRQTTNNPLDFALEGDGMFVVASDLQPVLTDSDVSYTRAGNFYLDESGDIVNPQGLYLIGFEVDPNGEPVLNPDNSYRYTTITIPTDAQSFNVQSNGVVNYIDADGDTGIAGRVALANFANPAGLLKDGSNHFLASENSGTPQFVVPESEGVASVISGSLEMSNVDLAEEFTEMITAQRGFQANTRIITTSDEILQELVNLKR
ncbi:flagellar basal body rod protein FlgG [Oceanobacillus chungangensis]|uniref:Flagellar hook protein FlgE n=1 Tax=Oceanobacillus chungangensis TaxID=1229152 RepID=A0A3D8PRN5_9BACI|nr:flagellar basal body rod protein FlgG [Oceanobacillus chungangensis]RDW17829.1 flagellar basal body rod protein FlgG [Oceanobacillus chungangensis]